MDFDFDSGQGDSSLPEIDRIQTQESADDRQHAHPLVKIDATLCEDTGVCAQVCPEDVFESNDGHTTIINPAACTECWICVENCISAAIEIG
jgi:MinD superfamily P-loop ATPase